jgi:hypothetical protein
MSTTAQVAARLDGLVRQLEPLLESLVSPRGEDFHYAAIWGQTPQESRANPAAIEKPGSNIGGIGLWQHTGITDNNPRRRDLERFAASLGKPWQDPEVQVRFVARELNTTHAHAWAQTLKTTTPEAAAGTFMALFEGPAGWQQELHAPGTTTANLPNRIAGTKAALAVIRSLKPGADKMSDLSNAPAVRPIAANTEAIAAALTQMQTRIEQLAQGAAVARGLPSPIVGMIISGVNMIGLPQMIANQIANADIDKFVDTQVPALMRKLNVPAPLVTIVETALQHFDVAPLVGKAMKSVDWEHFLTKGFGSFADAHGVTLDLKAN